MAVAEMRDPNRPRALDLFSGTGVVGGHLSRTMPVTGVDVQEYARVLTSAQLLPARLDVPGMIASAESACANSDHDPIGAIVARESAALDPHSPNLESIASLIEGGSLVGQALGSAAHPFGVLASDALNWSLHGTSSTIFRYYGGVYFSYAQAIALDALAAECDKLPAGSRDVGLACVLAVASELVTSVGSHFAQPPNVRSREGDLKAQALLRVIRKRRQDPFAAFARWARRYEHLPQRAEGCFAVRSDVDDYLSSLSSDVGCAYADPPYTREHYSRFYHVLETIASRVVEPGIAHTTRGTGVDLSKGLYPLERYQSEFSIMSAAPAALTRLCDQLSQEEVPLVLSYSPVPHTNKPRQRVMSVETIMDLLASAYKDVRVVEVAEVRHSRLNSAALNSSRIEGIEEVLFLAS